MTEPHPYWAQFAPNFIENSYGNPYSMNAVRLRMVLDILGSKTPGRLLDVGCGGGVTTSAFLKLGWDCRAVDFSADMVKVASQNIASQGFDGSIVSQAGATDLSKFEDASFDAVICIGVLYYIEQDDAAYAELARVLKPGGTFIFSHQNALFDMFTFNRYTRRFFAENLFPLAQGIDLSVLDGELAALVSNPEAPKSHDKLSARDHVFTKAENPLTFPEKMRSFGLNVDAGPYWHGLHLVPPLMEAKHPELKAQAERSQYDLRTDWRGMFMAAHFLMSGRKNG